MIPSLESVLQCLMPVFTQPSFWTFQEIFLGWLMCLGKRTEYGVFQTIWAHRPVRRDRRHPFDRFYNFFSRSAWEVSKLAYHVAVALVLALNPTGLLYLVVDDTLLHKRGKHVYGLGWFRDAVASTAKRVATASGNHWVVVGLAISIPLTEKILCLPIHALLHLPGQGKPSEAQLARQMLQEILSWFPDRQLVLIGDGAYSAEKLLSDLDPRVAYVGRMRGDAEIYDPAPPPQPQGKRGRKPKKGPRLPSPRDAAKLADQNRDGRGPWAWRTIQATAYGVTRTLQVLSYGAVWPRVLGYRPIRIVVVRDPEGKFRDAYLFTTELEADLAWVVSTFARRWSIEVAFRASKQVLEIEAPHHWCQQSIEKLAPSVWLMQSIVGLWYLTVGHKLPEARAARRHLGPWDTEWSLRHMIRVLRNVILKQTINAHSATKAELEQLAEELENYVQSAA